MFLTRRCDLFFPGEHLNWTGELDLEELSIPAVWCMASQDNLIVVGCGTGRIEVTWQSYILHSLRYGQVGQTVMCWPRTICEDRAKFHYKFIVEIALLSVVDKNGFEN